VARPATAPLRHLALTIRLGQADPGQSASRRTGAPNYTLIPKPAVTRRRAPRRLRRILRRREAERGRVRLR
jgi:hypothetical protein